VYLCHFERHSYMLYLLHPSSSDRNVYLSTRGGSRGHDKGSITKLLAAGLEGGEIGEECG